MEKFTINNESMLTKKIKIPEWEMEFRADRSSGPGGQNVNKTASKITLKFKVSDSKNLTDDQKKIVAKELENRMNKEGEVVISEQSSRSQLTNKLEAMRKLNDLINEALIPEKERKATRVPKGVVEKGLQAKKAHSLKKKMRGRVDLD